MTGEFLTIRQAAELLQVHQRTIRRAIKRAADGDPDGLTAIRVGDREAVRIRRVDFDAWIERRTLGTRRQAVPNAPAQPAATPDLRLAPPPPRRGQPAGHLRMADARAAQGGNQ